MSRTMAGFEWVGPQLGRVLQRFPWSVLAAVAFAAYFFFGLHRPPVSTPEALAFRIARVPSALTAAFLWSLAVALYAEARSFGPAWRHGLTWLGFGGLALLLAMAEQLQLSFPLLVGALLLGVGIAPYLRSGTRQSAYWRFNHDLWVGFLAAAVAGLLFGLGLSAIVETLRFLFGFNISYEVHEKIWAASCGLAGPLYWASVIPEDFRHEIAEGPPQEFISRMVALMVKFILVPLLLVYAAILHIYAVKIGFDATLPKGRLGWLVLFFGIMTVLTALLAYPTRASSGALVALFWRVWPFLLAVPLLLLFVAVGTRIAAYGVTPSRYWVVVAATWLAVVAGLHAFDGNRRDLRTIPLVLSLLSFVACLGAWGMNGWSMRSQFAELTHVLDAAGLLQDGRIKAEPHTKLKVGSAEGYRAASIVQFFVSHHQLARLKPIFAGDVGDPFVVGKPGGVDREQDWALAERVRARIGVAGDYWARQSPNFANYYASPPWSAPIGDGVWLISGGHSVRAYGPNDAKATSKDLTAGGLRLRVSLEDTRFTVQETHEGGARAIFDLLPLDRPEGPVRTAAETAQRQPIVLQPVDGALQATLIVSNISVTRGGQPAVVVNSLGYSLIVREKR